MEGKYKMFKCLPALKSRFKEVEKTIELCKSFETKQTDSDLKLEILFVYNRRFLPKIYASMGNIL